MPALDTLPGSQNPASGLGAGPVTVAHLRSASGGGGGPDKTIFTEAALVDPGRVRLLCLYLHKPGDDLPGIRQRAQSLGVPLTLLPGGAFVDPRQLLALARLLRHEKVDVLHCHEPKGDAYGMLLALLPGLAPRGMQVITTLHGWTSPRSRKSALYARLDRHCLRALDLVLAVSRPLEAAARQAGARRVQYLPNGVDTQRWQCQDNPEHPILDHLAPDRDWIGYVGRLSNEKAPDLFLQAAALVARQNPRAGFVLAGEGPELEPCRRLAASLGIADRTLFPGRLEEAAIHCLLQRLTALANPSRTEGLPNNVLEAMAMARPVVATAVGGVPDLVAHGETGFLVPPNAPDALAAHILTLLHDAALARHMGEAGRARVEGQFSFHARVDTMTAIYESLAGRP